MNVKKLKSILGTAAIISIAPFFYFDCLLKLDSKKKPPQNNSREFISHLEKLSLSNRELNLVIEGKNVLVLFYESTNNNLTFEYRVEGLTFTYISKEETRLLYHNQPITNPDAIQNASNFGKKVLEIISNNKKSENN
ncbi:hypothetical protein HYW75_02490 [Candidatus Pacearchaeota archaeon]|nr:hypothetical protein [Candidatus Pacearchaeota archaeon]